MSEELTPPGKQPLRLVLCLMDGTCITDVKLTSPPEIKGDLARLKRVMAYVATIQGDKEGPGPGAPVESVVFPLCERCGEPSYECACEAK